MDVMNTTSGIADPEKRAECGHRSRTLRRLATRASAPLLVAGAMAALSLGCATYGAGSATSTQPSAVAAEGHWKMVPSFPLVRQVDDKDCGAAALASVMRFWGYNASPESIETALGQKDNRLQAGDVEGYARRAGLRSHVFYGTMKDVIHEVDNGRPVIVGLGKMLDAKKALSHYEVVVGYEPTKKQVLLLDPARGWQVDSFEGFAKEWAVSKAVTIVAFRDDVAPATGNGVQQREATTTQSLAASNEGAIALRADEASYEAREAASPDAKKYRGGDVIVISASAVAVILCVVLLILLL